MPGGGRDHRWMEGVEEKKKREKQAERGKQSATDNLSRFKLFHFKPYNVRFGEWQSTNVSDTPRYEN